MSLCYQDLSISFKHCSHFLVSFIVSQVASWLMNDDNSENIYILQKVKEDPNSFCCHFYASIYAYLIVYQTKR